MFFDSFSQMDPTGESTFPYYYCFFCPNGAAMGPAPSFPMEVPDLNARIHPSENKVSKEFKCRSCNKFFKTKATADSHHKNIHEKPSKVNCAKCGQVFSNKYILKKHVMKNHPARPEIS